MQEDDDPNQTAEATIQTEMSVNSSFTPAFFYCIYSRDHLFIFIAFIITKVLLSSPLSILIFYLGYQRWRQQRSFITTSHSDIFTYHLAAVELNGHVASVFFFCGIYTDLPMMANGGFFVLNTIFPGQMFFHNLTCVDRYLAVVHPITYLGLRQSGGVRIRNISIGCVWLLCFGWMGVTALYAPDLPVIPFLCLLVLSLVIVSFCSLCVLCVLIHPGPGDVGRDKEQVDQTKQKAFHTVETILGVLWLWFLGFLVCIALTMSTLLTYNDKCVIMMSASWLSLPSSLVLPLLFLHRAGKLPFQQCT